MASAPRFSFGDFTEEEHNCYLIQPGCVEFPNSCNYVTPDIFGVYQNGDITRDVPYDACNNKIDILRDENQNHMPNEHKTSSDVDHLRKNDLTMHHNEVTINGNDQQTELQDNSSFNNLTEQNSDAFSENAQVDLSNHLPNNIESTNGHLDIDNLSHNTESLSINGQVNSAKNLITHENDAKEIELDDTNANSSSESNQSAASHSDIKDQKQKPATWAALFSGSSSASTNIKPVKTVSFSSGAVAGSKSNHHPSPKETSQQKKKIASEQNGILTKPEITTEVTSVDKDPFSKQIADQISRNEIVYRSPGLMPRGFINSSNWCYINATLQALLTSSPFCHLMRSFPSRQPSPDNNNVIYTSTPILDSFVRLVKELKPLPKKNPPRPSKEQWHGPSHEPEYIYKMLSTIKSKLSERGRQEDAEEFLSCVLNGLHEEMLKVTEFYFGKSVPTLNHTDDTIAKNSQVELGYEVPLHEDQQNDDSEESEEQWEEVTATRKNKSYVMRRADISKTPVSDVFRGELRSDLFQEGQRGTATLEPFFTLPLDINDQKTWSVGEALEHFTRLEPVQDFTNTKTKVKVEANRKVTLETLPPVLILHLKRFVYDKEGGSLKIDKEVQYHTDLIIGKELLSKTSKKIALEKRSYKLFAVVYHHGKKSSGGHYSTDVYHDGLNCWLRIDDQHIKTTNVHEVVKHTPQRTAYLLYYKRTDLMVV
ncbi:ubiquitin carboxyl-terminal hydrolase 10-like [Styela clava]